MATELRYVEREELVTEHGDNICRIVKVLQFRVKMRIQDSDGFRYTDWGAWKDVPTVSLNDAQGVKE